MKKKCVSQIISSQKSVTCWSAGSKAPFESPSKLKTFKVAPENLHIYQVSLVILMGTNLGTLPSNQLPANSVLRSHWAAMWPLRQTPSLPRVYIFLIISLQRPEAQFSCLSTLKTHSSFWNISEVSILWGKLLNLRLCREWSEPIDLVSNNLLWDYSPLQDSVW